MAFKLRHLAICDLCPAQQEVWAYNENNANEILRAKYQWVAENNEHVCQQCQHQQVEEKRHVG